MLIRTGIILAMTLHAAVSAPFNPLVNYKSGISLGLSGANGTDWVIERTYHDPHIGDQIIYLKSNTVLSLAHNENNTFVNTYSPVHVIGIDGIDTIPNSGDEGAIHFKIDRDQQAHAYTGSSMPAWTPLYTGPFSLDTMMHDDSTAVMGTFGDNGGDWNSEPSNCKKGFFGLQDAAGNEWHTLTYWDDDVAALQMHSITVHRQGASDGHYIPLCVNPLTPVIQCSAATGEEFYTTPAKTYHIPRIWAQTTYLTGGVLLNFVNLTDAEQVRYRVDGGTWQTYDGTPLAASALFSGTDQAHTLEVKNGADGTVLSRAVVIDPDFPGPSENHGYLMWADATELAAAKNRVKNVQPFLKSYQTFAGSYYQQPTTTYSDVRGAWRATAGMMSSALQNAFYMVVEGPDGALDIAKKCKERMIRMARVQPVGTEADVNAHSPAKDYMNELSQTLTQFMDGAVAYDLLAGFFRTTDHSGGMTPIEEYWIRDGLAEVTTGIMGRMRANYSASIGGGDTHWSHGYEKVIAMAALAMPTYDTPYYGTSGGDFTSTNTHVGTDGYYWNPYMNNHLTWYDVATDPLQPTDGHPDARYPVRSDFLMTDGGYWTGPNDMQGDGNRYYTGPAGSRLVDVNSGGLANANCRVELVEMAGYESPFTTWTTVLELARRIKGDPGRIQSEQRYIRRRMVGGYIPLSWNGDSLTYTALEPRYHTSLCSFNDHFEYAGLPTAKAGVDTFLTRLNIYYGLESGTLSDDMRTSLESTRKTLYGAYPLATCAAPDEVNDVLPADLTPLPPLVKPLMKHVVQPGEKIRRAVIATDPCGLPLTISVTGLPAGAVYDSAAQIIIWDPAAGDLGVHLCTVSVSNGVYTTVRPCPLIVKTDLMASVPGAPQNLTASIAEGDTAVQLTWEAPSGGTADVVAYFLYRDGAFFATAGPEATSYSDHEFLAENSHIRYHVSAMYTNGSESSAASHGYITTPARPSSVRGRLQPPAGVVRLTVTPNPVRTGAPVVFSGSSVGLQETRIVIRTADGMPVRVLVIDGTQCAWDGRDRAGKTVQPGIYYYTVKTDGNVLQGKLVVPE